MDGENKGKPYEQMDDLGGFPPILGNTQLVMIDPFPKNKKILWQIYIKETPFGTIRRPLPDKLNNLLQDVCDSKLIWCCYFHTQKPTISNF